MSLQKEKGAEMRIKIQLFNTDSVYGNDTPDRVYHFKITKKREVEVATNFRKSNDLEDTIREFIEDYMDSFLDEIKKPSSETKFLKEINEKSNNKSKV